MAGDSLQIEKDLEGRVNNKTQLKRCQDVVKLFGDQIQVGKGNAVKRVVDFELDPTAERGIRDVEARLKEDIHPA